MSVPKKELNPLLIGQCSKQGMFERPRPRKTRTICSYVSGLSVCIFVTLYVRISVAGANKVEGTMS